MLTNRNDVNAWNAWIDATTKTDEVYNLAAGIMGVIGAVVAVVASIVLATTGAMLPVYILGGIAAACLVCSSILALVGNYKRNHEITDRMEQMHQEQLNLAQQQIQAQNPVAHQTPVPAQNPVAHQTPVPNANIQPNNDMISNTFPRFSTQNNQTSQQDQDPEEATLEMPIKLAPQQQQENQLQDENESISSPEGKKMSLLDFLSMVKNKPNMKNSTNTNLVSKNEPNNTYEI